MTAPYGAAAGPQAGPQAVAVESTADRVTANRQPAPNATTGVHGSTVAGAAAEVHRERRPAAIGLLVPVAPSGQVAKASAGNPRFFADGLRSSTEVPKTSTAARLLPTQAPTMSVGTAGENKGQWFAPGAIQQPKGAAQAKLVAQRKPSASFSDAWPATRTAVVDVESELRAVAARAPAASTDLNRVTTAHFANFVETGAQTSRVGAVGPWLSADTWAGEPGATLRPTQLNIGDDHPLVQNQRPTAGRTDLDVTAAGPQHADLLRGDRKLHANQKLTMASCAMDTNALPDAAKGTRRHGLIVCTRGTEADRGNGPSTRTRLTQATTRTRNAFIMASPTARPASRNLPRAANARPATPQLNKY